MPTTYIINAVKTYIQTYTGLKTGKPVWVNYLGDDPTQYAIVPLPGAGPIEQYINGGGIFAFPFAFQSVESTVDELERLANIGFYEAFSDWLRTQTKNGTLPTLGTGKTALEIAALGFGYLFEQGNSETGIYQVQCQLTYRQAA